VTTLDYFLNYQTRVNAKLEKYLPKVTEEPCRLHEAMRYTVLNGGKRLRPALIYATGETLGVNLEQLDGAACAIELIHAFSLVHDDLPAMDDDDWRRGQLACHKAFDEATAILAGDALQTLAFEILSSDVENHLTATQKLQMIIALTKATSSFGMAGGQALEFAYANQKLSVEKLEKIYQMKTGALMRASVQLGAIAANASELQLKHLDNYAHLIGLAYQIQDDIHDGIPDGDKTTYLSYLGLTAAQKKLAELHEHALKELDFFEENANPLRRLTDLILHIE
jgi:farnesyl diphosphate synthase